jgi:hypothetical protein
MMFDLIFFEETTMFSNMDRMKMTDLPMLFSLSLSLSLSLSVSLCSRIIPLSIRRVISSIDLSFCVFFSLHLLTEESFSDEKRKIPR